MKIHLIFLTDNDTCGSGGIANSLGKASCTCCKCEQIVICHSHASCFTNSLYYMAGSKTGSKEGSCMCEQLAAKQAASH